MNRQQIIDEVTRLRREDSAKVLERSVQLLHENCAGWNWVGIYFLCEDTLVLGQYVGKPTEHTHIKTGVGVCGSAVADDTNIIVDDVTRRDNYLACTLETRSEIVVLIRDRGRIVGQFDIDSDREATFTRNDEQFLEQLALIVSRRCAREADMLKAG